MIIYSVTISIVKEKADQWQEWMKTEHILDVMNTGFFERFQLSRLSDPVVEENMSTFNIQYYCQSQSQLDEYRQNHSPALQRAHNDRYTNGEDYVSFRTELVVLASS